MRIRTILAGLFRSADDTVCAGAGSAADSSAVIGKATLTTDGRFHAVNPALCALLGQPAAALIGRPFHDVAHPDDRAASADDFRRLVQGEASGLAREMQLIGADGQACHALVSTVVIPDQQGNARQLACDIVDVTHHHQAGAALRAADRRQRFLVELEDRLRALDDADAIIATATAALGHELAADRVHYTEIDTDQGIGRVRRAWTSGAIADNSNVSGALADFGGLIDRLRGGTQLISGDITTDSRFANIAGNDIRAAFKRWGVQAVLDTPLVRHGRLVALLNVNQARPRAWSAEDADLAAAAAQRTWAAVERALAEGRLRRSEALLSAVLDALPVGVIIADAQGALLRDNAAHRELWGAPPLSASIAEYGEWVGYRPDTGKRLAAEEWAMARAISNGEVVRGELVEAQRFDTGARRFFLNNAAPIRDASGTIIGGVVAELDVTERLAAERALAANAERISLALAAGAIIGTWFWDLPTDRFTVDKPFAEAFGLDPTLGREGLSLAQVIATVHPDDVDGLQAAIAEAIARGGPYAHQYRVRRTDGRYYWIEANGRVDHAPDGTPLAFPGVLIDIEDRRALAEERDRATRLLETFIEAVPGVVYAKDRDGRILVANRGLAELVGRPVAEITGKFDADLFDTAHADAFRATDLRVMALGKAEQVEEFFDTPDGRRAVWISTKAPLRDEAGNIVGLIGSTIDITARKAAEQRVADSESMLRRVLDNLFAFVGVLTPDGILLEANAAPLEAAGIALADVMGKPFWDAWWWSYDAAVQARIRETCGRAAAGETVRYDIPVRMAGGVLLTIDFQMAPLRDSEGRITHLIPSAIIVEDRVQAQAALQRLNADLERRVAEALAGRRLWAEVIEATDAFIQVLDTDLRFLAINRASVTEYQRRLGVSPKVGDPLPTLLGHLPEERKAVTALWQRALAGESFTVTIELADTTNDRRWYEIKFSPLHDASGHLVGATQIAYDVTEREARQQELASAQAQLYEMQKLETIGQLTGGVAHDFNNLLTPIMGSLDMLQRRVAGDVRAERQVSAGLQAAERAKTLVARLLSFARRQLLETRAVDIPSLVQGMTDLITRTIGLQVRVVIDVPADLPAVQVDPNQLELALLNLAVNARDAMPGGGTLTVAAQTRIVAAGDAVGLTPGCYVCLSVADTGIGMDAETMRRAIEPFYSTKGVGKGTGLGLSMVHGLAAQSGGRLMLSSTPGAGTRADIWLPVANAAADQPAPAAGEMIRAAQAAKILLVDDETLVRLGTADMLDDLGYDVVETGSGVDALARIADGLRPDVLVTDYLMPDMNGAELVEAARRHHPGLPALMITGYADLGDGAAGRLPRLSKPFRQADLAARIAELLAGSPAQAAPFAVDGAGRES